MPTARYSRQEPVAAVKSRIDADGGGDDPERLA